MKATKMAGRKPTLSDKFWLFLHKHDSFAKSCFELRLAAVGGKVWRTEYLIDKLRTTQHPDAEDEIGYAMQKAGSYGQTEILRLMADKKCGLTLWRQPQQEQRRFRSKARRDAYMNSAAYRLEQAEIARLQKLNWREIAFLHAVTYDRRDAAAFLLESGVKADIDGGRALLLAASKDFRAMTALLLDKGADPSKNNGEAYHRAVHHDAARMFGESCLDPLLARPVDLPKQVMEAILTTALKENNLYLPTVEKVLNFALRMTDKADVRPFLTLPAVQQNTAVYERLHEYQDICDALPLPARQKKSAPPHRPRNTI